MRSKFLFIAGISMIIMLFNNCRSAGPREDSIITATLKGPGGIAMIKMIEERPVINIYNTSFILKNEPGQVRDLMIREKIDIAVLPSTMAALLYNKGLPYILAAIPVWGTLYLFGSDPDIRSWGDLKGKTVSLMGKGMTPDVLFRYLAKENGLEPERDIFADYSFPTHIELANAIAAGVSKLGVISEPQVSMVVRKNPDVRVILDLNSEWKLLFGDSIPFAQTALLVHKELAARKPEIINSYCKHLEESINWVNENIPEASLLVEKYKILPDRQIAEFSIPRCNLRFMEAWKGRKGIEEYLKVFYIFNPQSIGGKLPDESFYFKKQAD